MGQGEINWEQVHEWDEKYYLHVKQAAKEYRFLPVSHTEGNFVHLVGGLKLLDFVSQIIGANLGFKHPRGAPDRGGQRGGGGRVHARGEHSPGCRRKGGDSR